ncbi:MAG: hypothetical protein HYX55_08840 [Chloroflexi bacterium]|nr:hypothetical protein [Chloroflexota bacterium]
MRTFFLRNPRFRRAADAFMFVWFSTISASMIAGPLIKPVAHRLGWDAVVYVRAARALLAGDNPWVAGTYDIVYAAPPPSMLPYLPFVWLSDEVVAFVWVVISAGCSLYAICKLGLPLWWLAFPPVAFGVASGNSAALVLALLVRGGVLADAAAVLTKIYVVLPLVLLNRWRGLALAAVAGVLSALFLDWPQFLGSLSHVSSVLKVQSQGGLSATVSPVLFLIAVLGLVALGRRRAAWLIVPALWPDTQLYYASIALPVIAGMPLVALAIASPSTPGFIAIGLGAQAVLDRIIRQFASPDGPVVDVTSSSVGPGQRGAPGHQGSESPD